MMMVRGERDTLSPGVHEDLYTMYLSEVYHSIINIIGIPHLGYPGYRVQYPRNTWEAKESLPALDRKLVENSHLQCVGLQSTA
jgi:hypothetical protein